ncbi:helix-turn-helix domain-containing protein [Paenibacillus apiarius]|uniref:helix-turn-helix domain-containing protein n=1 Tax=Paenibacillus apiarius TaxID=46240 RepID=UPI003B3B3FAC
MAQGTETCKILAKGYSLIREYVVKCNQKSLSVIWKGEGMRTESLEFTSIGDLIRTSRQEANLTLTVLEERSGVGKGIISKIENGETKRPDFKTMQALAGALDLPYADIVELYLSVEQRADVLMSILRQSVTSAPSLCTRIASRYLLDERKDSYDLVEELYTFVGTVTDNLEIKLALYKLIIDYTRSHGIQTYYAKALLQEYLIQRDKCEELQTTYHTGKGILNYVQFLTNEEQIKLYYKLGVHAYHLNKYEEAIESFHYVEKLDVTESKLKADAVLLVSFCCFFIGNYKLAEENINKYETYSFPAVLENVQFMRGKLNAKKGKLALATNQLQGCLMRNPGKIYIIYELIDLYLRQDNFNAIEQLIKNEKDYIEPARLNPLVFSDQAFYYKIKSDYYYRLNRKEDSVDCLLKSATLFFKIDRKNNAHSCFELLFDRLLGEIRAKNENIEQLYGLLQKVRAAFHALKNIHQEVLQ